MVRLIRRDVAWLREEEARESHHGTDHWLMERACVRACQSMRVQHKRPPRRGFGFARGSAAQ